MSNRLARIGLGLLGLLAAGGACAPSSRAPGLTGLEPEVIRARQAPLLRVFGENLLRLRADFDRPARSHAAAVRLFLEGHGGARFELVDVTPGEDELTARLGERPPPGTYALVYESGDRTARLDRALRIEAEQGCAPGCGAPPVEPCPTGCPQPQPQPTPPAYVTGTFTKPVGSGTTTQTVQHGLGTAPVAAIFFSVGTPNETVARDQRLAIGFTDQSLASFSVTTHSVDDRSSGEASRRVSTGALSFIATDGGAPAVEAEAIVTSWTPHELTLQWAPTGSRAAVIHYVLIGGASVRSKAVKWTAPATAGTARVTGVGFEPSAVLHTYTSSGVGPELPDSAPHAIAGFGGMAADASQWSLMISSVDDVDPVDTQRGMRPSAVHTFSDDLALQSDGGFASMDPDGFSLVFAATPRPAQTAVFSLALAGVSATLGCFLKIPSTASSPEQAIGGVGLQPAALLFAGMHSPVRTAPVATARLSLGATDGTRHGAVSLFDASGGTRTNAFAVAESSVTYAELNSSAGVDVRGQVVGVDADGFRMRWSANDSAESEICFVAFGR